MFGGQTKEDTNLDKWVTNLSQNCHYTYHNIWSNTAVILPYFNCVNSNVFCIVCALFFIPDEIDWHKSCLRQSFGISYNFITHTLWWTLNLNIWLKHLTYWLMAIIFCTWFQYAISLLKSQPTSYPTTILYFP